MPGSLRHIPSWNTPSVHEDNESDSGEENIDVLQTSNNVQRDHIVQQYRAAVCNSNTAYGRWLSDCLDAGLQFRYERQPAGLLEVDCTFEIHQDATAVSSIPGYISTSLLRLSYNCQVTRQESPIWTLFLTVLTPPCAGLAQQYAVSPRAILARYLGYPQAPLAPRWVWEAHQQHCYQHHIRIQRGRLALMFMRLAVRRDNLFQVSLYTCVSELKMLTSTV